MISILSGVKLRASQRGRNNRLMLEWRMDSRRIFLREPLPPTMRRPGRGVSSDLTTSN
jgi:hypothetical protein